VNVVELTTEATSLPPVAAVMLTPAIVTLLPTARPWVALVTTVATLSVMVIEKMPTVLKPFTKQASKTLIREPAALFNTGAPCSLLMKTMGSMFYLSNNFCN
jgi:hypothetical protein